MSHTPYCAIKIPKRLYYFLMRPQFSLFQSHLDLAHELWKGHVLPGDTVVDATLGNGHDALFLARLALRDESGTLFAFDIQKRAHTASLERLKQSLTPSQMSKISFHEMCHSRIGEVVPVGSAKLIVYNLGYLPGEDKSVTTKEESTLLSLASSLNLITSSGLISITCYPGHAAGRIEEQAVTSFCERLDPKVWNVSSHRFLNRREHPHLSSSKKLCNESHCSNFHHRA